MWEIFEENSKKYIATYICWKNIDSNNKNFPGKIEHNNEKYNKRIGKKYIRYTIQVHPIDAYEDSIF